MKKLISIALSAFLGVMAFAQGTGGIKGTVVNRLAKTAVDGAELVLKQNGTTIATLKADKDGSFLFENLNDGSYQIEVGADGYMTTEVFVIVEKGLVRDLMRVSLSADANLAEVDASSFTEFDMADSGYS
ncbi:MAG: carboxypeptidase-like regulatory domain-containing protein, partial [Bacteroidales bacterium]|nr:carboxypeptidase-like regulatory domain-containing protein [Bacteroidales bacterium]